MSKPITAIIVGAGHRALVYAELAITNPELMKIVGVADPNPVRREMCMKKFGFSEDMCFETAQELATKGKLADTIINGTMDHQHLETAIPLRCLLPPRSDGEHACPGGHRHLLLLLEWTHRSL